jgi:hypothetical protein
MLTTSFRDLAQHGLLFVLPDDCRFSSMLEGVRAHELRLLPDEGLDYTAILCNNSDKAIVALAYVWEFTAWDGKKHQVVFNNLGSSGQYDVLRGTAGVVHERYGAILPGSKRLITEHDLYGDNSDVLPEEDAAPRDLLSRRVRPIHFSSKWAEVELYLDAVFFEDGLCVGPDKSGLIKRVMKGFEEERAAARDCVKDLRKGATRGKLFDRVRGMAGNSKEQPIQHLFAIMTIDNLIRQQSDDELIAWFERFEAPRQFRLCHVES